MGRKHKRRVAIEPSVTGDLEQPLLPIRPSGDEEEGNVNRKKDNSGGTNVNDEFTDDIEAQPERGGIKLVCRNSRCRKIVIILALHDLITTLAVAYFKIYNRDNYFDDYQYSFKGSIEDVLCLTAIRTIFIVVQATWIDTFKMAKIAGYSSLISFLLLTIKASVCIRWNPDDDNTQDALSGSHFAAIILISLVLSLVESFIELLIGIFSCATKTDKQEDGNTTSTVGADAEGINVDKTKSIGLIELLKVLRPYFWPDGFVNRTSVLFTWIFLIISKLSSIAAPLFIAEATDDLTISGGKSTATFHIIMYAVLLFANKAFKEAQALCYIRVKLIAGVQLKTNVFSHLLTLSTDWHQRKSIGAVIIAMQRGFIASNAVVQYLFLYLFPTFVEAIVVCIVFITKFNSPLLAACACCGVVIYTAITIELTVWRMQYRKKMNKADNDASHKATDALLNFDTVKYFTAEQHEVDRYRESVDQSQDQAYKIQGSLSSLNTLQQLVLNVTLVAALLVAAYEYRHNDFTIGQFVAVNVYVIQLFAPLNFLGSIYGFAVGAYVDLQNLCNLLAEKPDVEDRIDAKILCPSTPISTGDNNTLADSSNTSNMTTITKKPLKLQFRNVSFAYPSRKDVPVLKDVSFKIPAGTTTAIVGESGSGKSTITRLLYRFYEADQGRVLVGSHDVLDLTQTSLRENLGAVPQDHALFNDTMEYNVRYGSSYFRTLGDGDGAMVDDDTDGRVTVGNAIEAAQLNKFVDGLPDGLQTQIGEKGHQVSGGEKQRIAIARVLLKDAPVLILDEATSSLDSGTEEQIQLALFGNKFLGTASGIRGEGDDSETRGGRKRSSSSLRGRKTMVVIAHRLSTIQDADQILVMYKGEILERGTHKDLLAKGKHHNNCYAALWDKQKKAE